MSYIEMRKKHVAAKLKLVMTIQKAEDDLELSELDTLAVLNEIMNDRLRDLLKSERSGTSVGDDL